MCRPCEAVPAAQLACCHFSFIVPSSRKPSLMTPHRLGPFVEKTILSATELPWLPVKNRLPINMRVYSGLLILFHRPMSVPHCLYYCSVVPSSEMGKCESSDFVVLSRDGFGSGVSCISVFILESACRFLEKGSGVSAEIMLSLRVRVRSKAVFPVPRVPVQEPRMSFLAGGSFLFLSMRFSSFQSPCFALFC